MSKNKTKLWIKALWLYIWYKPSYTLHVSKYYDDIEEEEYEMTENRWYLKKRATSWILLFPILFIPIMFYSGIKGVLQYFIWIFTYQMSWVSLKKEINFRTKLDIILTLI